MAWDRAQGVCNRAVEREDEEAMPSTELPRYRQGRRTGGRSERGSLGALRRRLDHVLEPAMRRALVREWLAVEPDRAEESYRSVRSVLEGADGPLRDALQEVLAAPVGAPGDGLGYEQLRGLYEQSVAAGDEGTARLLRAAGAGGVSLRSGEPALPPDLVDVPLGRRRALAKGSDPGWLERLARDSDPLVLRHWLQNPRVRELEVVRVAASRPVARAALEEIARHPRWRTSEAVRSALARNPHSPLPVALRAAAGLPLARLRELVRDPDIHEALRETVRERIARRRG